MSKVEPASFDAASYTPGESLQKLLDELVKAANTMITHVGNIGILLNEIVKQGRSDGLSDIQIRQLVDSVLGENRTIRKYLPKELKKHNYPEQRKQIEEIGKVSNIEDNNPIEVASVEASVEETTIDKPEKPSPEKQWQDFEALNNKIDEQDRTIDDFENTLKVKDELIAESESKLRGQAEQIEMLNKQLKDYANNLRETPEFQKATRHIEIAYEDYINHWRSEYEKVNKKFQEINLLPKIVEFSPSRLNCLDLIFKNQDGVLYLQHDGIEVIKVTAVKPIERGGQIVS